MSQALEELSLRLVELKNDLSLLEYAFELRPRINQVLDFEKRGEVLELARKFGALAGNQPASFYGPMLIRLVASFERYLRSLMRETVEAWVKKAKTFDQLPEGLGERNLILSGRFIANSDFPREHLSIDLVALVDNLATCRTGSNDFKLNSSAFMTLITGVTPDVIENSLKAARITNWWNAVGADRALQTQLNSTRTSDTTKKAATRLKELSRWRNNWAHGGDDEVSLTNVELTGALEFLSVFSKALDVTVAKQIHANKLT
jgi:hypothetical protein